MVRCTDNPESMIARAARISHHSPGEEEDYTIDEDQELIRDLKSWGHWSPIEFASATFYVEGISRSCLAQLTRHRLVSFMVRSMRYVKQGPEEVVVPQTVKRKGHSGTYRKEIASSWEEYENMVEDGVPKEDARFLLPIGSKTSLYIKTNFREYRHIIELRGSNEAQWEICELADQFLGQLSEIAPAVFEDLE